jgi:DNA-binding PadR family transcriptional regulator
MYGGYLHADHKLERVSMSVRMSILAMVAQRPSYGYLLRAEFDRRTGATRPLNIGQVYKTLDTLERDGLVARSATTDADGHVFYEATEAGRVAVDHWLSSAEPTEPPARSDLAIKIAVAATLPRVDLDRLLAAQRQAALGNLQRLTREMTDHEPDAGTPLSRRFVADAILFEAETQVRWLDHVEQRLRQARRDGIRLDVPFDTDPPRRGRPPKSAGKDRS